jgi:hypothetical protein
MYNKPEIQTQVVKPKMFTKFGEEEFRILDVSNEASLDSAVKNIENFITFNEGRGKSELEKDTLYANAKQLWGNYVEALRTSKFKFYLNEAQFDYFTKILTEDMEYDSNTIFFGIELTDTLGNWAKQELEAKDDSVRIYETDPVSVNYMNHLIATVKIKGLGEEAYLFAQVFRKITEIMKVVNFYDAHAKSLSKEVQDWVANFEDANPQDSNQPYSYNNF